MKVGKAAAATAVAGLVLLGSAGSASALTLDLSGIGGLVRETTSGVSELLGGTPELPAGIEAPSHTADAGTDGIHVQVGNLLDVQIGVNAPPRPAVPAAPSVPAVPGTPGLPAVPGAPSLPATPGAPSLPAIPGAPAVPSIDGLPAFPPQLALPDMPAPVRDFALIDIDFWRTEVQGVARPMVSDAQGWVESGSSFAYRTAGMTVDLAGLASVRLMLASAYEQVNEAAGNIAP